jgi:hypothetical protein
MIFKKITWFFVLLAICFGNFHAAASDISQILEHSFYINEVKTPTFLSIDKKADFENLDRSLTIDNNTSRLEYYHIIKEIKYNDSLVILEDGSSWKIGWWYSGKIYDWEPGERLKIFYDRNAYSNNMELVNIDRSITAWGVINTFPNTDKKEIIARIPNSPSDPHQYRKVILQSGWVFLHELELALDWQVKSTIFVFHSKKSDLSYDLWNMTKGEIGFNWTLTKNERPGEFEKINLNDILQLESKLNQRVLSQPEAAEAVSASFLNYAVGLKDPKTPIGVFLFLGPTGVGKTEMAKVLTDEIFKSQERLIRFDMSHFSENHSLARLIGSPPGYVNHEEGGQLTESLKSKPQSIVLLDEIEKAHSAVRKLFLPVFDEGYITDSKNIRVECNHAVFVMTSNLCSQDISELFYMGYESEEILQIIEPQLLEALSPELYNRVEPIVFHPLGEDTIGRLVELMLADVIKMLKIQKNMDLSFDESVVDYLKVHGFHPTLGARPLKKLIQKKVSASLSFAIIKESIPEGSSISLAYYSLDDSWHVSWE